MRYMSISLIETGLEIFSRSANAAPDGRSNFMDQYKFKNFNVEQTDSKLTVVWCLPWFIMIFVIVFTLVWMTGWSYGCIGLFLKILKEPQLGNILFALPFFIGWFFGAGIFIAILFGRQTVWLDHDGLHRIIQVLFLQWNKRIPLDELTGFDVVAYSSGNNAYRQLRTGDFVFAYGWEAETTDLAKRLNALLNKLRPGAEIKQNEPEEMVRTTNIPLNSRSQGLEAPPDSHWEYWSDFDRFGFLRRNTFSLFMFVSSLFPTLFWNGIVSVFVLILCGVLPLTEPMPRGMWWFMFFFLIPFELIGLSMIWSVLKALLPSQDITKWTFSLGRSEYRTSFLGIGKKVTESLESWKTLELHEDREDEDDDRWSVVFLSDAKDEILDEFSGLTEAEARWIADVILRERSTIQ